MRDPPAAAASTPAHNGLPIRGRHRPMADPPHRFALSVDDGIAGGYLLAVVGSAMAVAAAALIEHWLRVSDLSLVFMLAVLVVASRTHTGPAVVAAVLCFLAYNFFFIEPRFTLYIG